MGHADCSPRDFSLQSQSQSETAVHSRRLRDSHSQAQTRRILGRSLFVLLHANLRGRFCQEASTASPMPHSALAQVLPRFEDSKSACKTLFRVRGSNPRPQD